MLFLGIKEDICKFCMMNIHSKITGSINAIFSDRKIFMRDHINDLYGLRVLYQGLP